MLKSDGIWLLLKVSLMQLTVKGVMDCLVTQHYHIRNNNTRAFGDNKMNVQRSMNANVYVGMSV
jgi:hypothetical protein